MGRMNFFNRLSELFAAQIVRRKWWIITAAVLLLLISLLLSQRILIRTQLKDMLPKTNPLVQSYTRIDDLFSTSSIILTFEGPDRGQTVQTAGEVKTYLENDPGISPYIETIQLEVPRDFITQWGMYMQDSDDIRRSRRMLSELNLLPFITALNDNMESSYTGDAAEKEILTNQDEREMVEMMSNMERGMVLFREYLEEPDGVVVKETAGTLSEIFVIGDTFTFDPEGRMLLMTIVPSFSLSDYDRLLSMEPEFRRVYGELEKRYPELSISYTGDLTMEFDEQEALSFDLLVPSLIALVCILILFVFSFKQLRAILLALITLLVGIVYDIGIIGATFAELNLLTSAFAVILIGLGIDFSIHIISNYTDLRSEGLSEHESLQETFRKSGSSILIGGITTAIAFFVLMFSGTKAITQFGFIAGWGIITCLASTLILLPALLLVFGSKQEKPDKRFVIEYSFLGSLGNYCARHRSIIISAVVMISLAFGFFLPKNRVEYDVNKLTVTDSPTMITERRIRELFNYSAQSSMVSVSSIEEARRLTEVLKEEFLVAQVASVSEFIPSPKESAGRLEEISLFRANPPVYRQDYTFNQERLDELEYQIQRLEWNMIEIGDLSVTNLGEDNLILKKRNAMIREIFGAETGQPGREVFQKLLSTLEKDRESSIRKLDRLDRSFAPGMAELVLPMLKVQRPMGLEDIPEMYRRELISTDRQHFLVSIQPTEAVAQEAEFLSFNERMSKINPEITGTVQLGIEWTREMVTEAKSAAVYVFIAISILLALTYRRTAPTLLSILFLLTAMIWMFGMLPLLGIRLNLISVITLPMIIGLGIDYAVHIVHRCLLEGDIARTMTYSGKGVLLSGITTGFGFGSLALFGNMAGIASFGGALFLGVMVCLFLTFLLLPSLAGFMGIQNSNTTNSTREVSQ